MSECSRRRHARCRVAESSTDTAANCVLDRRRVRAIDATEVDLDVDVLLDVVAHPKHLRRRADKFGFASDEAKTTPLLDDLPLFFGYAFTQLHTTAPGDSQVLLGDHPERLVNLANRLLVPEDALRDDAQTEGRLPHHRSQISEESQPGALLVVDVCEDELAQRLVDALYDLSDRAFPALQPGHEVLEQEDEKKQDRFLQAEGYHQGARCKRCKREFRCKRTDYSLVPTEDVDQATSDVT